MGAAAAWGPVATVRRVLDRYGSAGGGLLAGGLAYAALFAIVPGIVLLTGISGLVIDDPEARARLTALLVGVLPPLGPIVESVLDEVAQQAAPVSLLGAVALVWGASRFAVAFDGAFARVMGGTQSRGLIARNLGALGTVVLMIGAILLSTVVSGLLDFLEAGAAIGLIPFLGAAVAVTLGVLPVIATIGATVLVYRVIPVPAPTWRAAIVPGVVVGLVLTVVARAFAFLAPRLIGSAALLGTVATAFAALAWLSLSFQALLIGAAWVRDRADRTLPPGARDVQP